MILQNAFNCAKGVRKGGWDWNPPLSLTFYKNFFTFAKEIVFAYFLLVNLST